MPTTSRRSPAGTRQKSAAEPARKPRAKAASASAPDPGQLSRLATEQLNPASADLDLKTTTQILTIINREDAGVPAAVRKALPQIARAVDLAVDSFQRGGRLIYVGTGTSGRLGVLDASECPPTFSVAPSKVVGVIAGGPRALYSATEASEDDPDLGARDLRKLHVNHKDTVVGIAASGRTPYTMGALEYARQQGAHTVALACVAEPETGKAADVTISVVTGPEVVSGSTRMKAGTAQKLVLNMLSTAAMVRTGHVFGNLMVNVRPSNQKLEARAERILGQVAALDAKQSKALMRKAGDLKVAILMAKTGLSPREARQRLEDAGEDLRAALAAEE